MATSNAFTVFQGSTIVLRWAFYDTSKRFVEATGLICSVYSNQQIKLCENPVVRQDTGVYTSTIDTSALELAAGEYIVELIGVANGLGIAQRDYLIVKFLT